ncbi:MAG: cysteine hydrolase [Clostridiales bacterium]|nr:cysteine hydrolase [Clostridiales bacterium]
MKPLLIVVDMQNDFITQALGTPEARAILPAAVEKIKNWDGLVFYTRDTHHSDYLNTAEGKKLPVPHCIENSEGWELAPEIAACVRPEDLLFDKPTFGSTALAHEAAKLGRANQLSSITLIGLCTDICVISNAMLLKAALPEIEITVDPSCCAGVTPESHENALRAMAMCQITVSDHK